ncbi:MAG TPA: ABC transporter permease [Acidobacteriota bacterium]|nr:ABC transporter permease [Acidobacteriota bacterium]
MAGMLQDFRFALRSFAKRPTFVLVAVLTLALGIGANTAIFSVVNAVVLKSLPYPQPQQMVKVEANRPWTLQEMEVFQQGSRLLQAVTGYSGDNFTLTGGAEPEIVPAAFVSASHFKVMGRGPSWGRGFQAQDQQPGAAPTVILSHGLWQRRFGGQESILGQRVAMSGGGQDMRTVIGIMPRDYRPLDPSWQAWAVHEIDAAANNYFARAYLLMAARLSEDAALPAAAQEVDSIVAHLLEEEPNRNLGQVQVFGLREAVVGQVRSTLLTLWAAAGLVLLIACANVANLLLARADSRTREMAIRTALGARRGRLARQLITESVLLGLLGGGAGLGAAYLTLAALSQHLPSSLPRAGEVGIDWRVMVFALAASMLCGLLFGLAPVLRLSLRDLQSSLRDGGRGQALSSARLHSALVVGEVALTMVLVASAGLMLKSLWLLNQVEPGYHTERVLTLQLVPPSSRYSTPQQRREYFDSVTRQIAALPGVESAEGVFPLPMTSGMITMPYEAQDHPLEEGKRPPTGAYNVVTIGYFRAMGVPIVQGRGFESADRDSEKAVAVINESMARRLWPDKSPVGKQVRWKGNPWFEVVGVAADVKQSSLDGEQVRDMVYRPYEQDGWLPTLYLTVRTQGDPHALIEPVRQAVWQVDRDVPVRSLSTMQQLIEGTQSDERFLTRLLVLAGGLALILGVVGVYGVMALAVSGRKQEFGVRLALGASCRAVVGQALWRGTLPALLGILIGIPAALLATGLLAGRLYQVTTNDPLVLSLVALVLLGAAVAAAYLPARRAGGVDPLNVLKAQ